MNAKTKALKVKSEGGENKIDIGYINRNGIRRLSSKEQADKAKGLFTKHKGSSVAFPTTEAHKREHQNRFKRAYNE